MLSSGRETVQDRIKKNGSIYGNKAANLIELDALSKTINSTLIRIQVPEIFPIDDKTVKAHLDLHAPAWRKLWAEFVKVQAKEKALSASAKIILSQLNDLIIATFAAHPVSDDVIKAIKLPADTLFMVRSTGEEDTVDMANPGGNKSVAAVKLDKAAISNAMGIVVASYVSEKSLTQRLLSGDDISKPSFMPVLMQRMIGEKLNGAEAKDIVVSGVMYAYHDEVRIDAAPGHGELIVNSKAPFDTYDITPAGLVHAEVYQKDERLVPVEVEGGKRKLVFKSNPKEIQNQSSLSPQIAKELAKVGEAVAVHYGMPMDIEFVYHPELNILYLVQARPIPQDLRHKINPSAIAPEQWVTIKKDETIPRMKCHVVKSAGNAAKVITAADQVIHKKYIDKALKYYLKNPDCQNKVRAVVIKFDAPSTSHEAAFFNALGIPVVQASTHKMKTWLQESAPVLIVDPQHQHVINYTKKIKNPAAAEQELKMDKVIVDGLYVSAMSASETLLPVNYELSDEIKKSLAAYFWHHQAVDKKNIYQQLLENVGKLEDIKVNNKNESAFAALKTIAEIFKLIGTSSRAKEENTPHKALFQHAMLAIAEIHLDLTAYSALTAASATGSPELEKLLDAVAKLRALVVNPGKAGLYSDSLFQVAAQNKAANAIDKQINGEQRQYLTEYLKLNSLALRQATKDQWLQFAIASSKSAYSRKLLANILMISAKYHFESELINKIFTDHIHKNTINNVVDYQHVLRDLFAEVSECESEFVKYQIKDGDRLIAAWENKIEDWSIPAKFERLFADYQREVTTFCQKLTINDGMQLLTQKVILKQVQRLTDMMDKSIKSLKGSPEYAGQTELLVSRFAEMLRPYLGLMAQWMNVIPESSYDFWASRISGSSAYNTRSGMIEGINQTFLTKSRLRNAAQLEPSSYLSVASATVGTSASFYRQFMEQGGRITLEDLFSLMHQNLLASTIILGKKCEMDVSQLPEPLQPFLTAIATTPHAKLLAMKHDHHTITLEYNIPLDNHSAKLSVNYDTATQSMTMTWGFFGRNWENRMDTIAKVLAFEGLLYHGTLANTPVYSTRSSEVECVWKFPANQFDAISKNINNVVDYYARLTESPYEDTIDAYRHILKSFLSSQAVPGGLAAIIIAMPAALIEQLNTEFTKFSFDQQQYFIREIPAIVTILNEKNMGLVSSDLLSNIIGTMDASLIKMMLERFGKNIDLCRKIGNETLFNLLTRRANREDMIAFLQKVKPNLSLIRGVIAYLMNQATPDRELIKTLLSAKVQSPGLSLEDAICLHEDKELTAIFGNPFALSTKEQYSWWLAEAIGRDDNTVVPDLIKLISAFHDKIDFSFQNVDLMYSTLLTRCMQKMKITDDVAAEMLRILPPENIMLSVHVGLLPTLTADDKNVNVKYIAAIIEQAKNLDSTNLFSVNKLCQTPAGLSAINKLYHGITNSKWLTILHTSAAKVTTDTSAAFIDMLETYHPDIDVTHRFATASLIERLVSNCNPADVVRYLQKYKPDLSTEKLVISAALERKDVSNDLVLSLLECGARFNEPNFDALLGVIDNPVIMNALTPTLMAMNKADFTKRLYDHFKSVSRLPNGSQRILLLMKIFKDKMDLDYTTNYSETLLQILIGIVMQSDITKGESGKGDQALADFIADQAIDLSKHSRLLEFLSCNRDYYKTFKTIAKNGSHFDKMRDVSLSTYCASADGYEALTQLLDKLTPQKLSIAFYHYLGGLTKSKFSDDLYKRYINKLDLFYQPANYVVTLLEEIIRDGDASEVMVDYFKAKRPDLSQYENLLNSALCNSTSSPELIRELIACKAPCKNVLARDLVKASAQPGMTQVIADLFISMGKQKLSRMLCEYLYDNYRVDKSLLDLLTLMKPVLDLSYKNLSGRTFLEEIIRDISAQPADLLNFLATDKIDLFEHRRLLSFAGAYDGAEVISRIISNSSSLAFTKSFESKALFQSVQHRDACIKAMDSISDKKRVKTLVRSIPGKFERDGLSSYLQVMARYHHLITANIEQYFYGRNNFRLLDQIMGAVEGRDLDLIADYLEKNKADLSECQSILKAATRTGTPNAKLLSLMIQQGAKLDTFYTNNLPELLANTSIRKVILEVTASWDSAKLSNWVIGCMDERDFLGEGLFEMLEVFGEKLDFNYTGFGNTLITHCIDKLPDDEDTALRFMKYLPKVLDLSCYKTLLTALSNKQHWSTILDMITDRGSNYTQSDVFGISYWLKDKKSEASAFRLLDKFENDKLRTLISLQMPSYTSIVNDPFLIGLIERYADRLGFDNQEPSPLTTRILRDMAGSPDSTLLIAFISRHCKDLSGYGWLLNKALEKNPLDMDLIRCLFAHGLKPDSIELKTIPMQMIIDNQNLLNEIFSKLTNDEFSAWLYRQIGDLTSLSLSSLHLMKIFASKINFDFKPEGKASLLELCADSLPTSLSEVLTFSNIISNIEIDIAKHPRLLSLLANNSHCSDLLLNVIQDAKNLKEVKGFSLGRMLAASSSNRTIAFDLLDKLPPALVNEFLIQTLHTRGFVDREAVRNELFKRYAKVIDPAYTSREIEHGKLSLMAALIQEANDKKFIMEYIEKTKPDLSKCQSVLSSALSYSEYNYPFIKLLFDHHADAESLTIHDVETLLRHEDAKLMLSAIPLFSDKTKLTRWFYKELLTYNTVFRDKVTPVYSKFGSLLDLNYRPLNGSKTLFELVIDKARLSQASLHRILIHISETPLDLGRHSKLLEGISTLASSNPEAAQEIFAAISKNAVNVEKTDIFSIIPFLSTEAGVKDCMRILDQLPSDKLTKILVQTVDFASNRVEKEVWDRIYKLIQSYLEKLNFNEFVTLRPLYGTFSGNAFNAFLKMLGNEFMLRMIKAKPDAFSHIDQKIVRDLSKNPDTQEIGAALNKLQRKHGLEKLPGILSIKSFFHARKHAENDALPNETAQIRIGKKKSP